MIVGVDSSTPPSTASIIAAKNAEVKLWAGYFAGPNILRGWAQDDFTRIQENGLATLAYCSGWSNPATMKAQSANWGVPICLDVENGIRGDGPWVQGWLDASGAGLYGNLGVHTGRRAAFHVLAYYPNPVPTIPMTWAPRATPPSSPCGWQYRGSHSNYGATIDSCWFDDFFMSLRFTFGSGSLGGNEVLDANDPIVKTILGQLNTLHQAVFGNDPAVLAPTQEPPLQDLIRTMAEQLTQVAAKEPSAVDPTLAAKIDALSKHLGVGAP